jgi:UDP-N-acetylglucosamine--N-acetylmuramyl-(pentapeptide) pyrophosphoryl-undecaprenol N-acetylglucosamine transferase
VRLLLCGGGTGGHVVPAVAVARALEEEVPGARVLMLGTGRPVEERILSTAGIPRVALASAPAPRSIAGLARALLGNARGLAQAYRAARAFEPDVALGLGGYASAAGVIAARLLGAPVALFEPNAVAGKATRLLSRLAREVYVHWPEGGEGLRAPAVATGTPIAARARAPRELSKKEARARFGLPDAPCVLIVGGSQGARALDRWALASLGVVKSSSNTTVLHVAGDGEAELRAAYDAAGVRARVVRFLDDMGAAYRAADLAVCRAGAATLAEACAEGLPVVAVPLPTSALDHQRANARALERQSAGFLVDELDLDGPTFLDVLALPAERETLASLRSGAIAAGKPDAARVVARRLLALAGIRAPEAKVTPANADKEQGAARGGTGPALAA